MLNKFLIGLSILFLSPSFAHEGHDEPKSMPAPKGGITRMNEKYFFEYTYKTGGGTVYLYTHDGKPAPVAGIETKAAFTVPRQKTPIEAVVTSDTNSWKIEAKLPKTHRFTMKFSIKDKDHADTLSFVVEPK